MNYKSHILVVYETASFRDRMLSFNSKEGKYTVTALSYQEIFVKIEPSQHYDGILLECDSLSLMIRKFIQHLRSMFSAPPLIVIYKQQTVANLAQFRHNLSIDFLLQTPTFQEVVDALQSSLDEYAPIVEDYPKPTASVWGTIEDHLRELCTKANAWGALLIRADGSLVAQGGLGDHIDLRSVSALVAANNAAANELSSLLKNKQSFESSSFAGGDCNIYTCAAGEDYLLSTIFGAEGKLGVIHFYTHETAEKIEGMINELVTKDADRLNTEEVQELSQLVHSELDKLFNPSLTNDL